MNHADRTQLTAMHALLKRRQDEILGAKPVGSLCKKRRGARRTLLCLSHPRLGVKTGRKGVGMWNVKAHGIASHAGLNPEAGASAILELARHIFRFHSMSDPASGTNFNVGVVRGGTRSNVVAAEAEIEIDVRFTSMKEAQRVDELMSSLRSFDERVQLAIKGGINRGPLERTEGVVKLYQHARDIAACLSFELGEQSVGGASDGNFVAALMYRSSTGLE